MTKIIVISDTHMRQDFSAIPSSFLDITRSADLLVHCGDFTTRDVYDFLSDLNRLEAVVGNMDSPSLQSLLPSTKTVEIDEKRIGIIHGWGTPWGLDKKVYSRFKECDIICFGHSHVRHKDMTAKTLMINPGPFRAKRGKGINYAIIKIEDAKINAELCTLK